MKVISIVIVAICLGVLNGFTKTSISGISPDAIVTESNGQYTFTITKNEFDTTTGTKVKFYKGTESSTTLEATFKPTAATDTKVEDIAIDFKTAGDYTMKVVDTTKSEVAQDFKISVTPTIIKSITTKIKKDTDESVTLTAATGHIIGAQKIQFSTTAPTAATTPTPITCTPATPATTAACPVNLKEGNYTLYVDTVSSGLVLQVSSQYLKLAFGLLISLFLF